MGRFVLLFSNCVRLLVIELLCGFVAHQFSHNICSVPLYYTDKERFVVFNRRPPLSLPSIFNSGFTQQTVCKHQSCFVFLFFFVPPCPSVTNSFFWNVKTWNWIFQIEPYFELRSQFQISFAKSLYAGKERTLIHHLVHSLTV